MKFNIKKESQAKAYIESLGIEIKPGIPYNIYHCGCVYSVDNDPIKYRSIKGVRQRCCPDHAGVRLLNKYKQCGCGRQYLGKRLQKSGSCKECWGTQAKDIETRRLYQKAKRLKAEYANKSQADPDRWNCGERDACMIKYQKYDTIPCKGCKWYAPVGMNVDPYLATGRGYDSITDAMGW